MKLKKIFLVQLFIIFSSLIFADNCPKCDFKNEDYDRYCLNCGAEIREISPEEKSKAQEIYIRKTEEKNKMKQEVKEAIELQNKKISVFVSDFTYETEITFIGLTNIRVMVTATNHSKATIKNLTINIAAECPSVWSGQAVKTLVEPFAKLMPSSTVTKEIAIFGAGRTLNQTLKSSIKINVKTMSWNVDEE